MPRLLGVEIPGDKRIEASLPYIYGIGPSLAKKVLEHANIVKVDLLGLGNSARVRTGGHVESCLLVRVLAVAQRHLEL